MPHPCYVRGTLIQTVHGEIAVEQLRVDDLLVTMGGNARPIRWIGTRSFVGRFVSGNRDILPVLVRAGALGERLPKRDLYVSPLHALYIDEVLVPVGALVNGDTIVQLSSVDRVDYFHIELESHDVILAEGIPAETFVDDYSRAMFRNAWDYAILYPDAIQVPAQFCAPRVEDGEALQVIRSRLMGRAAVLRGNVGLVALNVVG